MTKITIAILCYFAFHTSFAQTNPIASQNDVEARRVITLFAQSEFDGVLDVRADMAKFDAERTRKEKKENPDFYGKIINCRNDHLNVVSRFEIKNVIVNHLIAKATVEYLNLVTSAFDHSDQRKFVIDLRKSDTVNYALRYSDGKWWVFNPPAPRLSKTAIVKCYREYMSSIPVDWLERTNIVDYQKWYVRKQMDDLRFLEEIPNP